MSNFNKWCKTSEGTIKGHDLNSLSAIPGRLKLGRDALASIVPAHYASTERVANLLKRLGKRAAAEYILKKLPKSKALRSGDLGEILATSYVAERTDYKPMLNKLRWKDHREMAMRGDDLIAVKVNPETKMLGFLKGEVKSRVALSKGVISEARKALRQDNNRPSPHALSVIVDRLHELGKTDLANAIDDLQLKQGIKLSQIEHLLFAVSENDPSGLLKNDLLAYKGQVHQHSVGLQIQGHQKFISDVYDAVS